MPVGSLREKRPGCFELRVYVGQDPVTKRSVYKSETFHGGERAAKKRLSAFETELTAAGKTPSTAKTINWLLDQWIAMRTPSLDAKTLETYKAYIKTWLRPYLGALPIKDLTGGHLRELNAKMEAAGRSASTRHQAHIILRGALSYAVEHEWHDRNVAAIIKAPRVGRTTVVPPTLAELSALMNAAGEPGSDLWTFIALAASLGRRAGELCQIRRSHVHADSVAIQPTRKSPRVDALALDPLTLAVFETRAAWQDARWQRVVGEGDPPDDPYVLSFWSDGSGPPSSSGYGRAFTRIRDQLGLKHLHAHSLRHFVATHLLDQGIPLPVVAERLGHASPAVTARIYAQSVTGRDREAAEAMGQVISRLGS